MGMAEGERRGRIGGRSSNPYHEDRKYPEPTVCPRCRLVYRNGRWQDGTPPEETELLHSSHCPACRREIDRLPAGLLFLTGEYLERHRDEILNISRNQASAAASHRPLQRIMWIEENNGTTEIATTHSHLALRIGKAIESACKGALTIKHADDAQLVRVYWQRSE
jgi:hypothetical protein